MKSIFESGAKVIYATPDKLFPASNLYQGYANRDTWLAVLWLNNEQELYNRVKNDLVKAKNEAGERVAAKRAIRFGLLKKLINDEIDFSKINWDEVVKAFKLE